MQDIRKITRKWALYNAIQYDGKANLQAVISKVIREIPEIRKEIKNYIPIIREVVEDVNKMSLSDQRKELEEIAPELLEERKKEEKRGLPDLPDAIPGKFASRAAPNPNGFLHIGHTRHILLAYLYSRKYDGKFILRYEDTDPKVKRPLPEAYDQIYEDVCWLIEDKPDEVYIQSERLEIYYEYAKKLIEMGKAYVDLTPVEEMRRLRSEGKPTKYRDLPIEDQLELWEKMLNWEFGEGEAVLRIKTDLNHPNPSVRDWIAFRIVDTEKNPHPRVGSKYCVWPTYNFAAGIDDHLMGVTHIFRMKEHEVNAEKQKYIYKYFGWEYPKVYNYGALIVRDMPFHKSEIRKLIEEGKISGWDDPFLPTIMGLRRRGIHPKAIKSYIEEIGPNPVDIVFSWEKLYKYNREIYDPIAKRYFLIRDPVRVEIEDLPENFDGKVIRIRRHPEKNLGFRKIELRETVFLERADIVNNKYIRLMEAVNIEILSFKEDKVIARFIDDSLETARRLKARIVHWLTDFERTKLWEQEGKREVLIEPEASEVPDGEVVQFERVGFAKKEGDLFIYMHK